MSLRRTAGYLPLCAFLLLPAAVHAAVTINEIAWMGTDDSANDEWIELYNSGEAENLDGWILIDNANLSIELSGTIGAGEYGVLERTDDTSAPGSAFLVYTGALSNSGRTLTLRRADGSIEDQVAGGSDWENLGGDNETKATAQYTKGGWITAAGTPGRANATKNETTRTTEDDKESSDTNKTNDESATSANDEATDIINSGSRDKDYAVHITGPEVAYVDQPLTFRARASGVAKRGSYSVHYIWNLGDGSTDRSRFIRHTYQYPGSYVVVVRGNYYGAEQVARQKITVLPVKFSITRNSESDIQINNDAKYEINLSGYRVTGNSSFTMPENTILLPHGTITISKGELDAGATTLVRLYDQKAELVASTARTSSAAPNSVETSQRVVAATSPQPRPHATTRDPKPDESTEPPAGFSFRSDREQGRRPTPQIAAASTTRPQPTQPVAISTGTDTTGSDSNDVVPYLLLVGIMALGVTGLMVGRSGAK